MEQKRDKLWRKQQCRRVFKARLIRLAACGYYAFDEEGNLINHPHWFELAKQRGCRVYKTTGTPCSCMLCQGNSYERLDSKKTMRRIMSENLED